MRGSWRQYSAALTTDHLIYWGAGCSLAANGPFSSVPMSNSYLAGQNRGGKSRYLNGGGSLLLSREPIDVDDGGGWSREQYIQMDADFCAAMSRAIALGLEQRQVDARTSQHRARLAR